VLSSDSTIGTSFLSRQQHANRRRSALFRLFMRQALVYSSQYTQRDSVECHRLPCSSYSRAANIVADALKHHQQAATSVPSHLFPSCLPPPLLAIESPECVIVGGSATSTPRMSFIANQIAKAASEPYDDIKSRPLSISRVSPWLQAPL